jgi:transcriptional regulator with XRE-family HTH domain
MLRRYRQVAGLTQEELARKSGLSVRAVADMERGRTTRPYPRSVALLGEALGLAGEDLTGLLRAARTGAAIDDANDQGESAAGPGTAGDLAVPRQLPSAVPDFVGREAELAALSSLLDDAQVKPGTMVVSAIGGTAGAGKTALAVHWAHQVTAHFPTGSCM